MPYKPMFGSRRRESLWQREKLAAYKAGLGKLPICNLCGKPLGIDDPWDESHHPDHPKAFGGKSTGIAHRRCNREHGAKVVVPAVAKSNAVRAKHLGLKGPGLGRHPMPGGRNSRDVRTIGHGVVPRRSLAEKHAATMARRGILTLQAEG